MIGARLQEALGRRYFFVDVVGKVAQDADAVLHRLIGRQAAFNFGGGEDNALMDDSFTLMTFFVKAAFR